MKITLGILFIINMFVSCSLHKGMTQIDNIAAVDRVSLKTSAYSFQGALKYKFSGNSSAALDMFLFSVETDPTNAAAYYELANYDLFFKNSDRARYSMENAISNNPDNVWYKYKLADFFVKKDSLEAAVDIYENILERNNDTSVYNVLYSYYIKLKEYDKALDIVRQMEKKEGMDFEVFSMKLRVYYEKGDEKKVIKELEEWIRNNPYDRNSIMLLAQIYAENGDTGKSFDIYENLLKDDIYSTEINVALITTLERTDTAEFKNMIMKVASDPSYSDDLKDYAVASAMTSEYLKNDSVFIESVFENVVSEQSTKNTGILLKYARYLESKGRREKMIGVLEKVFELDPTIEFVNYMLFTYSIDTSDYEKLYRHAVQGITNSPGELSYYFYLAVYYLNKSEFDKALETCLKSIPYINSKSQTELVAHIYSITSSLYHEKGEVDKCLEAAEKALLYSPNNPTMLNDYAYFLALAGRELERAEDMASKALGFKPDDMNIIDTYAWVLFVKGNYSLALEYMEKLLMMSESHSAEVFEHAGDIYIMNGFEEKAVEMWKKAKAEGSESETLDIKIKNRKYVKDE